jgi:hypothetical protein
MVRRRCTRGRARRCTLRPLDKSVRPCLVRQKTRSSNKELKLTKPSVLELRSLTPVFGGLIGID